MAVDLGIIPEGGHAMGLNPEFTNPAFVIALWKRVQALEEVVKDLQEHGKALGKTMCAGASCGSWEECARGVCVPKEES